MELVSLCDLCHNVVTIRVFSAISTLTGFSMANPRGRPKESKNNPGHRAGGVRRGSGRKRKETRKAESDSPEPEAPQKRKKQKTCAHY
jgi:hypothetical protein